MVDSRYQQSFDGADESEDEGAVVDDDELLIGEQRSATNPDSVRWSGVPRASRRVAASSVRRSVRVRPGDTLANRYVVERIVGRSGPEAVVVARHLELGQTVRIRYLLPEASASPDAVARFQRGARKAREMRSEHAERVIDFGRLASGSPYRVSEVPSGPSLEEILRVRGGLDIGEAVDIMVQVCEPVAEAHASSVVHKSLCTSNIFVERRADGSVVVKVLDFGVSDSLELSPAGGSVFAGSGTSESALAFASPEQIRNPGAIDARADIWALGAILYELLCGVRVFEAETPLTLLAMIAADQPAPIHWLRPEVPEALEAIVLSCLEKDPERRPRSVVELANAIAVFGSGSAPKVATRVARMAMRSSRPPPLPSNVPPPQRSYAPTRAIVRSMPVAAPEPPSQALPGWAIVTGSALLGVCVALVIVLTLRPPAATPVVESAQPVAAPTPAPVAVVPTTHAAPATTAAETKPAPVAVAPAPAPRPAVQKRPAKKTEAKAEEREVSTSKRTATVERTPSAARVSAATEPVARGTPASKGLFGGIE
jgi:serine/threonine protein kinase